MTLSRRLLIAQVGAGVIAGAAHAQTSLAPTPAQTEGPFYPVDTLVESDADLTRLAGRSQRAAGQVIEVTAHVLDRQGRPIRGARVELWQSNAVGKYIHPRDTNKAPLDPNFQGFARLVAGADGVVRVVTVKPGAYPQGGRMRTPHLHWNVEVDGADLTTQMYFPGEALNDKDRVMSRVKDPRAVIARSAPPREAGALGFAWDIVLDV